MITSNRSYEIAPEMRLIQPYDVMSDQVATTLRWFKLTWLDQPYLSWFILLFIILGCATPVEASPAEREYKLAPGDVLSLDLINDDELPRDLAVGAHGGISVPFLGNVDASGLSVSEVADVLKRKYVERKIFVDPQLIVTVASYRQVFVLGDVKSPGSYPFRPKLTVEQAIGLAGGPLVTLSSVQDQILQRAKLLSESEALHADIASTAVLFARLAAQLSSKEHIAFDDLPSSAALLVDQGTFEARRVGEEKILAAERASLEGERVQILAAIEEANRSLSILNDLVKAQQSTVNYTKEELARKTGLLNKGLITATDVSSIHRQLATDEARLLSVYAQISEGRRSVLNLKRELSSREIDRKRDTLQAQQDAALKIDKLLASRKSMLDQLYFLTNWTSEAGQKNMQPTFHYKLRRNPEALGEEVTVSDTTPVLPGDVVRVAIERPVIDTAQPSAMSDALRNRIRPSQVVYTNERPSQLR